MQIRLDELASRKQKQSLPSMALHNAASLLLKSRYNIEHFYFGAKETKESLTKALSIVCLVDEKKTKDELYNKNVKCLPKTLEIRTKINVFRFKTDVQNFGDDFNENAAVFNPGDNVRGTKGRAFGTIGLIGRHSEYGLVCTTAGHVINEIVAHGNNANQILIQDREQGAYLYASTKRHFRVGQVDYAILQPSQQSDSEWIDYQDFNIDEPYLQPKRTDLSRSLWLLTRGQALHTRFRGIKLDSFIFSGKQFSNVIITDPVGKKGDSGAALIDKDFRVWGTLIGTRVGAFSVFMRISTLLEKEHFIFGIS